MTLPARIAVSAAICALSAVAAQSADLPFTGKWQGGPATCQQPFVFTDTSYTPPGAKALKIIALEQNGHDFSLTFKGKYSISLMNVQKRSMTWTSPESGDTFTLTKCK
jgi:hypothetical protein